jgi:N-acyl-D-aspartate/D-glutamate deacylase
MDRGLIVKIGENLDGGLEGLETVDADGAWVTPGIFDMVGIAFSHSSRSG